MICIYASLADTKQAVYGGNALPDDNYQDAEGVDSRLCSLAPVISEQGVDVLILGSMPGADSLRLQQYYAHRRNFFWPIMYRLFSPGDDPWERTYEQRLELLRRHHIGVWDVIGSCVRKGSLDQHIRSAVRNPIDAHLPAKALVCNGGTAFRHLLSGMDKDYERIDERRVRWNGLDVLYMPSTSPIPSKNFRSLEDRLERWQILLDYC